MRVSSTSTQISRRQPQQARAALRRAKFLDAAAELIGGVGLEAATMTAVAERAGASIGALYDYFPDKATLALALMARYAEEADAHWAAVLALPHTPAKDAFADLFVEGVLAFVRERPAYLPLLGASPGYARSNAARRPLRQTIAKALQTLQPTMSADRAFLSAQVIVELIKGLLSVYKQVAPKERETVAEEFKGLIRLYLTEIAH